jgi:hypothetical protein
MWVVRGVLADGQLVSISFTDRSGIEAIPSMVSEATTAIDSSPGHVSLAQLVQQDLLGPPWPGANPGADLIQRWAGEAVEAFATAQDGSFLQSTVNGALELRTGDQQLEAVAWHDYTFVVVAVSPVQVAVELLYSPEAADEDLAAKIEAAAGHRTTTYLDWRLYLGDGSAVVVGMDAFDHRRGPGRVRVATGQVTGWFVGKVVRRSTAAVRTLPFDRTVAARVRWYTAKYQATAATCPDLAKAPSSPGQRVIVIVHGTGSCAISIADALMKAGVPTPVYRFEHDTFVSITSNARELATLVQRLGTQALVLVCHSRGGLVGRQAASLLYQEQPLLPVQVLTFGTPHEGTPIANLAPKAIGMTYMLGFTNHGGLPYSDPVTAAFYYLARSRETPEGIAEMRAGCGFLTLLNQAVDPFRLESWGGCYDCSGPKGFGPAMKGSYGRQAFSGTDNDLVVATTSATSRGSAHNVVHCSHFNYFDEDAILSRLRTV